MKWPTWKVRNLASTHSILRSEWFAKLLFTLQLEETFKIVSWIKANLHLSGVSSGSYFFSKFLFLSSMLRHLAAFHLAWIDFQLDFANCFYVEPRGHKWLTSVYVKPIPYEQIYWTCTFQMIYTYMATQDYPVYAKLTLHVWRFLQSNASDILKMKNGRCK